MPQSDSLDKIIGTYFACVARVPFRYKGILFIPKALSISPLIFRGFTCPAGCGGCCHSRFTLDYIPSEYEKSGFVHLEKREVDFDGRKVEVYSDLQNDHTNLFCRNLMGTGRCGIHGKHPFSCDFELIRFLQFERSDRPNSVTQKLFGRGWNMMRVDGQRGALCEMTGVTRETVSEVVRKFKRLKEWTDYFGLETRLITIIKWCESGPHVLPLVLPTPRVV